MQHRFSSPPIVRRGLVPYCRTSRRAVQGLERAIRAVDWRLELLWVEGWGRWMLFRRAIAFGSPSDDILFRVLDFSAPESPGYEPNWWVIQWLHRLDGANFDGGSPEECSRNQKRAIDAHNREVSKRPNRIMREISEPLAVDIGKHKRNLLSVRHGDPERVRPRGKLIYGRPDQEVRHAPRSPRKHGR